jgi:hypothetical protein
MLRSTLSHCVFALPSTTTATSSDATEISSEMAALHSQFEALTSPSGTLKVTVGAATVMSRVWTLPKSLLAHHTTFFQRFCTDPSIHEVELEDIDARCFANFVDFMRSSIFSLNKQVPGFESIRHSIDAYILGEKLGAERYSAAAMTCLYGLVAPMANDPGSKRGLSPIKAEDVELVCTAVKDEGIGHHLRKMVFNAVASHWTQGEAVLVKKAVGWSDVFKQHSAFRKAIMATLNVPDQYRVVLLKPLKQYLKSGLSICESFLAYTISELRMLTNSKWLKILVLGLVSLGVEYM